MEHHPREDVLEDMTVSHPGSRIIHIDEDIDVLSGWYEDRILPDEIRIRYAILIQYEESLSMEMEWMLHRVHRIFIIISYADFYEVSFSKLPIYIHIFIFRRIIPHDPVHIFLSTLSIHHIHRIFPFDSIWTF